MLTPRSAIAFSFLVLSSSGCYAGGSNQVRQARVQAAQKAAAGETVDVARSEFLVETELESRRNRLEQSRRRLHDVREVQVETVRALDEALTTVQALEQDLKAAQARKSAIEQELARIAELANSLANAESERTRLETAIRETRVAIEQAVQELAALRARADVIEGVRNVLRQALETVEAPQQKPESSDPAADGQPSQPAPVQPDGKSD
ncbi:MAG: hypothetical protein KDB80_14280 [Planctomycetes bacterium]|nr:hypothetical protein [Planctomycetota bacterium]